MPALSQCGAGIKSQTAGIQTLHLASLGIRETSILGRYRITLLHLERTRSLAHIKVLIEMATYIIEKKIVENC